MFDLSKFSGQVLGIKGTLFFKVVFSSSICLIFTGWLRSYDVRLPCTPHAYAGSGGMDDIFCDLQFDDVCF